MEDTMSVKILIVGEPKTGKTSFIEWFIHNDFADEPLGGVTDFSSKMMEIDDMKFKINLVGNFFNQ